MARILHLQTYLLKFRSRLHIIQLVSLMRTKVVKKYGLKETRTPLFDDLKILEKNGLYIMKDGLLYDFPVRVLLVADNLGSHQVGAGFHCSATLPILFNDIGAIKK